MKYAVDYGPGELVQVFSALHSLAALWLAQVT